MVILRMKIVGALAALLWVATSTVAQAVPPGFNIQGRLTDANGVNREGNYSIKFTLFDAPTAGTEFWTRTYTALTVRNGNFQTALGDTAGQPMLSDIFATSDSRYLEIQVLSGPGISNPEQPLVPRQQLVSVPYAMRADSAETLMSTGSVTITAGGLERVRVTSNGNVGFGTNNPQAPLDVSGNVIAATPIASNHLATKGYVDAQVSAAGSNLSKFTAFKTPGQHLFTVPAGVTKILAEVWGAGGSGGLGGDITGSRGGGGGGYGKNLIPVTPGSNLSITVGNGGGTTSSSGLGTFFTPGNGGASMVQGVGSITLISATGGKAGGGGSGFDGSGGTSDAPFIITGERGARANVMHNLNSTTAVEHGKGGGSYLNPHGGGEGVRFGASSSVFSPATNGSTPGGGGGGASTVPGNGTTVSGGAGAAGAVILWY